MGGGFAYEVCFFKGERGRGMRGAMKLQIVKKRHLWSGGGSSVSIGPTCAYSHYSRRAQSLIGLIVPESANTTTQFVLRSRDFFGFVFCFFDQKNRTRRPG